MNTTELNSTYDPEEPDLVAAGIPPARHPHRRMILTALAVIAAGTGWLLNELKLFPSIDWIWTGGLFTTGLLILIGAGVNRLSFVIGPCLISASATSLLRQIHWLRSDLEAPILFIVFGVFLLLAHILMLPTPAFMRPGNGGDLATVKPAR